MEFVEINAIDEDSLLIDQAGSRTEFDKLWRVTSLPVFRRIHLREMETKQRNVVDIFRQM